QAGEDIFQVCVWVEAATTAAFDDGVNDGAAFSGSGITHEEPVFLADGGGANGIFHQVVVDLHPTVSQINSQCVPQSQRIINGPAQGTLRQVSSADFEFCQHPLQPVHDGPALVGAHRCTQLRPGPLFTQTGFDLVKMLDLPDDPARCFW